MKFCPGIKIHHSLFVPLPENNTLPFVKVNVTSIEFHKFAHTNACRNKNVDDGKITSVCAIIAQQFQLLITQHFFYK